MYFTSKLACSSNELFRFTVYDKVLDLFHILQKRCKKYMKASGHEKIGGAFRLCQSTKTLP